MSTSVIPAAASAALSATNFQPRGVGHKRGLQLDSLTDPSSSPASQTPSGSTQNLFGTLLNSLQQAIGLQHPQLGQSPAPAAPTAQAANAQAPASAPQANASRINLTA